LTEYFDDLDCHKGLLMGCLFGPGIACPGGDFFIPASNEPSGCWQTFGDSREGQRPSAL